VSRAFSPSHARRVGPGFTLIELLVVVSVILILAALLLPVVGRAQRAARDVECISNVRQVGLGFRGYLNQYAHIFPPHVGVNWGPPYWYELVLPFLQVEEVYGCPLISAWEWDFDPHLLGYGYNAYWLGLYWHTDVPPANLTDMGRWSRFWRSEIEVQQPSVCALVGDTPRKPGGAWSSSLWWPNSAQEGVDTRHGGGGIIAFVDGHAKKMYPKDMNDDEPWAGTQANYKTKASLEKRKYWDPLRPLDR